MITNTLKSDKTIVEVPKMRPLRQVEFASARKELDVMIHPLPFVMEIWL